MSHALVIEDFRKALPDKLKKSLNQELIDQINATLNEPEMYEQYRDNLLSYTKVMADGRFKISQYLEAVKYVSHKLLGCSNIDAFSKTFPNKIANWAAQGVSSKDIASYVSAYNKNKLVNLVFEQTLVPHYVLNQDMYQKALNVQYELMTTANSEKVRCEAANSLLSHLKMPETAKVQLDVTHKEDGSISALREATLALVASQRLAVQSGSATAQDLAHMKVVQGERLP